MNNKHLYFKDNPKSGNIVTYAKNSNFKSAAFVREEKKPVTPEAKQISLQLRILEEDNAQLKELLEEQTSRLAEVVATNAKFLSILAHDLRSPFQAIIGALELIKDSYSEHDEIAIESHIQMATHSANTTLRLLENLLSWTTMQNTAKNFTPVKIDLTQVIQAEIENANASATQKYIKLNHTIKPGLYATADPQMVKTILRNLINNAIKYSYLGGRINIDAAENDKFIKIDIKDNGVGISQNNQKAFFQHNELHSTRGTKNEHGTGLGLSICKEFVEINRGSISIESEPGKGSKISFTLPR